jgi:hypothetical protein
MHRRSVLTGILLGLLFLLNQYKSDGRRKTTGLSKQLPQNGGRMTVPGDQHNTNIDYLDHQ